MVGIIVIIIIHATGVIHLRLASLHHRASSSSPACQRSLFLYLLRNQDHMHVKLNLYYHVKFPSFVHLLDQSM